MSNISTVFSTESNLVTFATKKGDLKQITAEGAVFKGGAALAALKDAALDSALGRAINGRYQAAADILEVAFPSVAKACRNLLGEPCASKANMAAFLNGIDRAEMPAKGWSKKQHAAKVLVQAMRNIPAFTVEKAADVIEA